MKTEYIIPPNWHAKKWNGRGHPPVTVRRVEGTRRVEVLRAERLARRLASSK